MAIEVLTKDDLEVFRIRLLNDIKALLPPEKEAEKKWLRTPEVLKFLNISLSTLQNLCYKGILHPSKIGGLNYYRVEEIHSLLDQHSE
jgi:hypothetical protein